MAKPRTNGHSVDDIADQYLMCRDFGHAWRLHDVRVNRKAGEVHRVFQCLHECGTERVQVLSTAGFIVRNFYTYPEGYVLAGLGRLGADERAHIRVLGTSYYRSAGLV